MNLTFTHVRLLVSDYRACFVFYRDTMGFFPTFGDEESGYADFDTGGVSIALFDRHEMAKAIGKDVLPPAERGPDIVALIFAVKNVDEVCQTLQTRGVSVEAPPTDHEGWGIRTAHFRDPDHNLIEINQDLS